MFNDFYLVKSFVKYLSLMDINIDEEILTRNLEQHCECFSLIDEEYNTSVYFDIEKFSLIVSIPDGDIIREVVKIPLVPMLPGFLLTELRYPGVNILSVSDKSDIRAIPYLLKLTSSLSLCCGSVRKSDQTV